MSLTNLLKRRRRRNLTQSRFAGIESLERRVVLDGSAQLGVISPSDNTVIEFDSQWHDLSHAEAFRTHAGQSDRNTSFTLNSTQSKGVVLLPTFDFQRVYGEHGLIGSATFFEYTTAGIDAAADDLLLPAHRPLETTSESIATAPPIDQGLGNNRTHDVAEELRPGERVPHDVVTALAAGDTIPSALTEASNTHVPLEKPATIQPPLPAHGFLPAVPIAANTPVERFADQRPFAGNDIGVGSRAVADGQVVAPGPAIANATAAASTMSAQTIAEVTSMATLSRDRYFAAYEARSRAAWTPHSQASDSRSFVDASAYTPGTAASVRAATPALASYGRVTGGEPSATGDLWGLLDHDWLGPVAWSGMAIASHVLVGSSDLDGVASGNGDITQVATGDWNIDASSEFVTAPIAIIETMLPRNDAVTVLVGVSLMSAYIIADAKILEHPRRRRIAGNLRDRVG